MLVECTDSIVASPTQNTFNLRIDSLPEVAQTIPDQTILEGHNFTFQFDVAMFVDVDVGDIFIYFELLMAVPRCPRGSSSTATQEHSLASPSA